MEKNSANCTNGKCINEGITCDVKNCHYHSGDCYCTAEKIAVGPNLATSSADTICATFKAKKD